MRDAGRPYSIIKLHNFDERCWGVVDKNGALLQLNGLSTKMTRSEAQTMAQLRNAVPDLEGAERASRPRETARQR